jgi:5-methylcytosine-specific restriction endonuclease McrA
MIMSKNPLGLPNTGKGLFSGNPFLGEDKKPKRTTIPKAIREQVWEKYIGRTKRVGKCYCCKWRPITESDFEIGHNKSVAKGGKNNIGNLRPICKPCNRSMGTMTIEAYKKKWHETPKTEVKKKPKVKRRKKKSPEIPDLSKLKFPNL